jgi:hypothetical protein
MEKLVHETFNTPLGETGDYEGHSVIRTENGGWWYADEIDPHDVVVEHHAEIVRRVNHYPEVVQALKDALASARPHPMENGAMYHAWEVARKVLESNETNGATEPKR